ncbi:hypothetical protein [Dyella caseinilytica]|uniref:Uncharacterized protein n=1 Tax=Dyella caseinilytica TaxID=1849581 RepID=A0ABX7GYW8_9GAMM|nr:hypothetical protein [Dyella caseinilytica]QRN55029.1 hypothetical protein ISN74_06725 [Dyella caseinilytica]GFZ98807.1 hypothetical protein GCM10011408_19330 [Dyella caseinilytica]
MKFLFDALIRGVSAFIVSTLGWAAISVSIFVGYHIYGCHAGDALGALIILAAFWWPIPFLMLIASSFIALVAMVTPPFSAKRCICATPIIAITGIALFVASYTAAIITTPSLDCTIRWAP